mmetsp:Transcript_8170/g.15376  ORF Transcript_8170/g.15376 Transcript_8170/m.15376 type:complete len:1017 (-) Transcript_8170:1423-4473(-)|eukprot:CAMPEP_0176487032 /NCGR_PEP_ID=MMETSP0200_2-20121128/5896_1 /TAXON_ID=947934 /ORGANISM="Chaetoceros sp., Strain GSL56" /LENGTH=1016 /DNA_ID=CAMNT_0017883795 /DNA_START=44 /DNA_END=3094 /DNA_ORIENTATION=+
MKLSRIALFSLLSVIPLYANDHDIAEPIADDKMAVQPEDLIEDDTKVKLNDISILDKAEQVKSIGLNKTIDDAENDVVLDSSSSVVEKQAQHEEIENDDEKDSVRNDPQQTKIHTVKDDVNSSDGVNTSKKESLDTSESMENEVIPHVHSNTGSNITEEGKHSFSSSKDIDDSSNKVQNVEETDKSDKISESLPTGTVDINDEQASNQTELEKAHDVGKVEEDESNEDEEKSKPVEVDYANKSTGAQIVDKSKKFQGTSNLLVNDKDKYAMIECDAGDGAKYVIIGLSEEILVKSIKLSSYERYSSLAKKFQVFGSQTYPVMTEWEDLGTFDAKPWYKENKEQTFEPAQPGWARYLKFRFLEHYGNEHFCSYTQIKVHGSTTLQGFHEMQLEQNDAAEAAKAVVDEMENESYSRSDKRDADVTDDKKEEEVEEEDVSSKIDEHVVETTSEVHETDDGVVASTSQADKVSSNQNEEPIPNVVIATSIVDERKVESDDVEIPQSNSSSQKDTTSAVRENRDAEPTLEDSTDGGQKDVLEEADFTDDLQESLHGDILESKSNETQQINVDKTEVVGNSEDGVSRANHTKEMENVTVKNSSVAKSTPDLQNSEEVDEIVEGNPEPPSPPSVSNAVTSAINSVKNGSLMKDAVQGINKIIHSNAESKTHPECATHNKAGPPVQPSSDFKTINAEEINKESVVSTESVVNAKDVNDPEHNAVHPSEQEEIHTTVQSVVPQEPVTKMISNSSTPKTNLNFSREDLLVTQEMIKMLSVRFPNAKCLDYLDFAEFKRRTLEAVNQKGSASGEKPRVSVQKNEPIFKKLTDEIKGLQAGQSVYEQYIKAATSCYQRVILDLGNEVTSKQIDLDHRMKSLEDQIIKLKEESLRRRLSAEDFRAGAYGLLESLTAFVIKISPTLYSWCNFLIDLVLEITERIMADERVKKIMSIVVAYKRDFYIFGLGVLFSFLFFNLSKKSTNSGEMQRKDKSKRGKGSQHRLKDNEYNLAAIHNTPSLHTDEDGSY